MKSDGMTTWEISWNLSTSLDLKLQVADNMKRFGGSFVQALSNCIIMADSNNLKKLIKTFKNYFIEYAPAKWEGR